MLICLSGFSLHRSCTCCPNCCEFACPAALSVRECCFLEIIHYFWFSKCFCLLFNNNPCAFGRGIWYGCPIWGWTFYSFFLFVLTSCGFSVSYHVLGMRERLLWWGLVVALTYQYRGRLLVLALILRLFSRKILVGSIILVGSSHLMFLAQIMEPGMGHTSLNRP